MVRVHLLTLLAVAVAACATPPLPPVPAELVRTAAPLDDSLCIALDSDVGEGDARAQVWWWNPAAADCTGTSSSVVPATGVIESAGGASTLAFEVPQMDGASRTYRLQILRSADGYAVLSGDRVIELEPVDVLRLRELDGQEIVISP